MSENTERTAVAKLDLDEVSVLQRQANEALMVAWINADLMNRAHLDVRKSVVLYDGDKDFVAATTTALSDETLRALAERTIVRYWSVGV